MKKNLFIEKTPPLGESFSSFIKRIENFYSDNCIEKNCRTEDILILAHTNVLKALINIHLKIPIKDYWDNVTIKNGIVYDIERIL